MASVDIFLQRDAAGVADVAFDGDSARLLKDGEVVRDWTAGGTLVGVAAGDGYTLEVRRGEAVVQQSLAIGAIVVAAGQSNMAGWLRSYSPVPAGEHTYMFDGAGGWGTVTGDGAKVYSAMLARQLGVPVAMVDGSVSGSPLLEKNRNPAGYWLDPDGIYADFQALVARAGGRAEVVLWAQGEQDGYPATTQAEYAEGLATLVRWFQRDLSASTIALIELGRIEGDAGEIADQVRFPLIRAAQHQVAAEVPGVFVDAGSLGVDGSAGLDHANKLHRSTVSYAFEAFDAATALLARYGVGNGYQAVSGSDAADTLTAGDAPVHVLGRQGDDTILTGGGGDVIDGGTGADTIDAGDGDNLVRGDEGDDTIRTGIGSDMVSGGIGNDTVYGGAGGDEIWGDAGDDRLYGEDGADLLQGGAGNDLLDGGAGNDRMVGGAGDDTYVVGDLNDTAIELAGEGDDTILGLVSIDLADFANVENVTLVTGNYAIGDDGANRLTGSAWANTLTGNGGDDLLDGGAGADTMAGGTGDDTYVVDDAADRVIEQAGEGDDTVYSSVSYAMPAHVEELVLTGTAAIDARGSAAAEAIVGNAAANRIDGGGGADLLYGGAGDDTYVVRDMAAQVIEDAGGGADTVETTVDYALPAEVEHLRAIGAAAVALTGNALANRLTGNAAANVLDGGDGDDVIDGGRGDDTIIGGDGVDVAVFSGLRVHSAVMRAADGSYVVTGPDGRDVLRGVEFARFADGTVHALSGLAIVAASPSEAGDVLVGTPGSDTIDGHGGDDRIEGLGGNDLLLGGAGHDWLDGGAGNDTMRGGAGDDSYVVDTPGDVVVETAGEGVDTVYSAITRTLEAHVENLVLTGTAAINATGNALDNLLRGNAAANVLNGGDGADVLDGGAGADTMTGGLGDDTYLVDDAGDRVIEYSGSGPASSGYDTVRATISYVLPNAVEYLVLEGDGDLNGTGNAQANVLTGNAGANVLDGGIGNDVMAGGAGDDTYLVDSRGDVVVELPGEGVDTVRTTLASYTLGAAVENLTYVGAGAGALTGNDAHNVLTGGAGDDVLRGNGGNDVLDGGAGADAMAGGDGDDTYFVDHAGDVVTEYGGTGAAVTGYDTVHAVVSYILPVNVEALVLHGSGDLSATGNALNNYLAGNDGNNLIDGGFGFDVMAGGAGDDTYVVRDSGDRVVERAGEGVDTVLASVNVALADHVENVVLTGTAAIGATGNALANRITGNTAANALSGGDGDDVIEGGGGADTLTGGAGADTFVLRSGQTAGVRIADFVTGEDRIALLGFGRYAQVTIAAGGVTVSDGGVVQTVAVAGVQAGDVTLVAPDFGAGNVAPTIAPLAALTAVEDAPFAYTLPAGAVADGNAGDWLTVVATLADGAALPAWLTFDARTQTFAGTPGVGDAGTLALRITVTDAAGAQAATGTALVVARANHAPEAIGTPPAAQATAGTAFTLTLPTLFVDRDADDAIALSLASGDGAPLPAWLAFDAATGTLSGTPADSDAGALSLLVTATDRAGASASLPLALTVEARNRAPVAVGELSAQAALATEAFAFVLPGDLFRDDADDALVLTATRADGGALPAWLAFDAASGTFSGTPAYGDIGALALTVTATDRAGARAALGFSLSVTAQPARTLIGGAGNDRLTGATGDDTLRGYAGADLLDGREGADLMVGGDGDDTYHVDHAGDQVVEYTGTGAAVTGHDTVRAWVDYTLTGAVEALVLEGAADLAGTGNSLANTLTGNSGANWLDGMAGDDVMAGGLGDDTYVVANPGDRVVERAGEGVDTVRTSLTSYTLAAEVEQLHFVGRGAATLRGNAGDNAITGGAGADTLFGLTGSDWLDGGAGADVMVGGDGDDRFVVDHAGDVVLEYTGAGAAVTGIDTVYASVGFTLGTALENLVLTGTAAIDGGGNSLANRLTGNAATNRLSGGRGDDVLEGGGGADVLTGGAGADRFVLRAGQTEGVHITDFYAAEDVLDLIGFGAGATSRLADGWLTITDGAAVHRVQVDGVYAAPPEPVAPPPPMQMMGVLPTYDDMLF